MPEEKAGEGRSLGKGARSILFSGMVLSVLGGGWAAAGIANDYADAGMTLFSGAVFLAALTTIPYLGLILWLDRQEKEPPFLIALAFLWGAVVATSGALMLNEVFYEAVVSASGDLGLADSLTTRLAAPMVEETLKGIAVLGVFLAFPREFSGLMDGLFYGAVVGLGFAFFENITYYAEAGSASGAQAMGMLAWARGLLGGVGSHALYTAIFGIGLGLVRVKPTRWRLWIALPLFLSASVLTHFVWNHLSETFLLHGTLTAIYLIDVPLAVFVLQGPFLLVIGIVVTHATAKERRIVDEQLEGEENAIITSIEREAIVSGTQRRGLRALFSIGRKDWRSRRRLESAQADLAFAKWHEEESEGELNDRRREILELRSALQQQELL